MKAFTDIGQFRQVVRAVKDHHDFKGKDDNDSPIYRHDSPYPTLKFRGTVKIHGSNSAIVKYADGHYEYQSRERVLSIEADNCCFMLNMLNKNIDKLFEGIAFKESCAIYGEWCGNGVQGKTAISNLSKRLILFAIRIDDVYHNFYDYRHLKIEEQDIYNIFQFENYELDIDFNYPEIAQNKLIEYTNNIEKQCPIGMYFGVEGIGEGAVWEYNNGTVRYIFKVKGKKHQNSKVKKMASIDIEEVQNIRDFVEYAVTENRLKQGLDKMKELCVPYEKSSTGIYVKWAYNDVIKEEQDTIVKNKIDPKKIGSYISKKAKNFWFNYLDNI